MWFGNLAELEAVLMRSMTMAASSSLDVEDLLFDSTRVAPRSLSAVPAPIAPPAEIDIPPTVESQTSTDGPVEEEATSPPAPEAQAPPAAPLAPIRSETVDLVIQELAHEFRNPMVTIKTLTQRLERLLGDKASREQVTRMTGEAVDRMDRALENLIQFTRFGKPVTELVALSPLVTACLSQLSPAFAERQVLLNYEPPEAHRVEVDGAQVGYAIENLLRVVLRDLRDGDTLAIHPLNGHGISLEFPARGQLVAEKLAEMADHPPEGEAAAQSIGFFFAKALVERNGGKIEIQPGTARTVIAVALPAQGDAASENGNASNSSSR
jgi:K+-sensing histidine kinase KdpD